MGKCPKIRESETFPGNFLPETGRVICFIMCLKGFFWCYPKRLQNHDPIMWWVLAALEKFENAWKNRIVTEALSSLIPDTSSFISAFCNYLKQKVPFLKKAMCTTFESNRTVSYIKNIRGSQPLGFFFPSTVSTGWCFYQSKSAVK